MEMEMETPQLHNYKSTFIQNTNNIIIIPIKDHASSTYLKSPEYQKGRLKSSAQISIFDAQKYFDETSPESDPKDERSPSFSTPIIPLRTTIPRLSSVSSSSTATDNRNYRARSFPTASSEASWNSQTGLLSNPPGALPVTITNFRKGGSNSNKWFFGRKCPCSGKKSVQVKEKIHVPPPINLYTRENHDLVQMVRERELIPNNHRQLSSSSSHENHFPSNGFHHHRQERLSGSVRRLSDGSSGFSFPILNDPPLPQLSTNPFDDPPRESLEVFQPSEDKSVTRKTAGRGFGFNGSPMSRVTVTDDDMASDASSDLFEIESFSTQTTAYPMYFRRDSPEEAQNFHSNRILAAGNNMYSCRRSMDEPMTPSIAPTEGYEPSEASIDWSVTTAEGFDRQSVTNFSVSASEIDVAVTRRQAGVNSSGGGDREGSRKKGNGGGLLMRSCRHEKAVSVGPQPVKCVAAAGEGPPAAMLPLMSSLRQVSSRDQNYNKPPVAGSNSARLSLAFAA